MIETIEILDLIESASPERSNDGQRGFLGVGKNNNNPGQQHRLAAPAGSSSHVVLQEMDEVSSKDDPDANSLLDMDYKDIKLGLDEEQCPVCGDRVSGYHYGLLTCESCKGFFKRTVQNKKVYSCVDNRSCQIDKSQRKRCPYCRFQKCLTVGMKLEAVRSDRMRGGRNKFGPMYKRDRALKQQAARHGHALPGSDLPLVPNGMLDVGSPGSPEDVKPDPHVLQNSLNMYVGAVSNSATSNLIPGLVPGPACLSASAAAPTSSASITTSAGGHMVSSSPPPAHPHQTQHHHQQPPHRLVPISAQDFTQNFVHITAVPQSPLSPKTYYLQPHRNHHHQQQQQHHHHKGNSIMERADSSPPACHQPQHTQALPDFLVSHNQSLGRNSQQRHGNNLLGPGIPDREPSYPSVIEALRCYQASMISGQTDRPVVSPLISEIKATLLDEAEVKHKMVTFMQNELLQTDIASPEQFLPVLCRMVDQLLFLMVEWARSSMFFKEIKVEDQMKLLHNSWSEILILDFIYRQVHNVWGKEIVTPSGDVIGLDILDELGLGDVRAKVFELVKKGRELKLDLTEYMCLKFIILLNPDVSGLENRTYIEQSQEKVTAALLEYCRLVYPNVSDKYSQLLMRLPEIRLISIRTEDFLYFKHLSNEVPDQTLLTEMLHAKRG
ncbi:unnamed protein product [Candidula unifasciata]|uniref:Uncharacterized protein n=1 Tax=Candidula unifasciata TaxID=100452 RepID=A0A8S3YFD2_9EUPU|nr:unnamed protein product [Candidula unifasciata]